MWKGNLLSSGMNAKTVKGDKAGEYLTAIMYLAPADMVEGINVCPMAEIAGCKAGCLFSAGRGAFNNVQKARIRKTILWRDNPAEFLMMLHDDVDKFKRYCAKKGMKAAVRPNGTSDEMWERITPTLFSDNPDVQFYDYTKIYKRAYKKLPENYHLTLSYSGANQGYAEAVRLAHIQTGVNMAVVYRTKTLVEQQLNTINGDETDLRFLDPKGVIVGLYAKGKAKHDKSGFVVDQSIGA